MIYKRQLFKEIKGFQESKDIIVITGMRRVGKTTLLNYFYQGLNTQNKIFLDLEDVLNQSLFKVNSYSEIALVFKKKGLDLNRKGYVFLDEIQFVKNIPSVAKYFYDHYKIKFYLTGSASFYLKNLFSESLAGRKKLFELFPLNFNEFLTFKQSKYSISKFKEKVSKYSFDVFKPLVDEYLEWGGMPGVVLLSNNRKEDRLRDVFTSYFQKEVKDLGDFRKNQQVENLIMLLSKRVGQKLDISRFSKELQVSRPTVYEYLNFLEKTYFISLVSAYGDNSISVRKQKKVYLIDCGFHKILGVASSGSAFEGAVYRQLRKQGEVNYFASKNQEIDFILKKKEKIFAFEVKETATEGDLKKLSQICKKLRIRNYYLVSRNFSEVEKTKYIFQLNNI